MTISEYRESIDSIDSRIMALLDERMDISLKIGRYKAENNLPISDPKREEEILGKCTNDYTKEIYKVIIKQSKLRQCTDK